MAKPMHRYKNGSIILFHSEMPLNSSVRPTGIAIQVGLFSAYYAAVSGFLKQSLYSGLIELENNDYWGGDVFSKLSSVFDSQPCLVKTFIGFLSEKFFVNDRLTSDLRLLLFFLSRREISELIAVPGRTWDYTPLDTPINLSELTSMFMKDLLENPVNQQTADLVVSTFASSAYYRSVIDSGLYPAGQVVIDMNSQGDDLPFRGKTIDTGSTDAPPDQDGFVPFWNPDDITLNISKGVTLSHILDAAPYLRYQIFGGFVWFLPSGPICSPALGAFFEPYNHCGYTPQSVSQAVDPLIRDARDQLETSIFQKLDNLDVNIQLSDDRFEQLIESLNEKISSELGLFTDHADQKWDELSVDFSGKIDNLIADVTLAKDEIVTVTQQVSNSFNDLSQELTEKIRAYFRVIIDASNILNSYIEESNTIEANVDTLVNSFMVIKTDLEEDLYNFNVAISKHQENIYVISQLLAVIAENAKIAKPDEVEKYYKITKIITSAVNALSGMSISANLNEKDVEL